MGARRRLRELFSRGRISLAIGLAFLVVSLAASTLVERWLTAHPEHPALPHLEDDAPSALDSPQAEANAALDATDPGAIPGPELLAEEPAEDAADDATTEASPSGGKRRS